MKFHVAVQIDTSLLSRLSGQYQIDRYILTPCNITQENRKSGLADFVLEFDIEHKDRKVSNFAEQGWGILRRDRLAVSEAKNFVSFLVLLTRGWMRLSSSYTSDRLAFGRYLCLERERFTNDKLDVFNMSKNPVAGKFVDVKRPDFSPLRGRSIEYLLFPSDLSNLFGRFKNLNEPQSELFLNACHCYQFALENWNAYPTISLVALVSAIEAITANMEVDDHCKDAKRNCSLKKGVTKRFRRFFEENLPILLPNHVKTFLNQAYDGRSKYLHQALLKEGEILGINVLSIGLEEWHKLSYDLENLEILVNAGITEWLRKATT